MKHGTDAFLVRRQLEMVHDELKSLEYAIDAAGDFDTPPGSERHELVSAQLMTTRGELGSMSTRLEELKNLLRGVLVRD